MPTTAERLDRLEAENAALESEVARLRAKVEPPPPDYRYGGAPVVELHASVTNLGETPPPDLTDDDVRELRRIVGKAHPSLISWPDGTSEDQAIIRFANAFRAVGMLAGTDDLDAKHSVAWWFQYARSIVDHDAGHDEFSNNDFVAAALARGVWYRAWSHESPVEFGLLKHRYFGHHGPLWDLKETWRPILKAGKINEPHKLAHHPSDTLYRDKIEPGDPDR